MSNTNVTQRQKVPMGQKIAFGFGMLANQMFPAVLGIFMVVLVQDLGFPGWMWSVIYFFPRIFDAFTDPIMGFISDNTKSRWGRRRQYVLIGGILMGISFIILWQLYKDSGIQYNFVYFMIWSFMFYLGLTIFSVPYVAMGYEMSDDFHERTNIMAIAQWIGQWAWVIAPWFWVIMYDQNWFSSAEVATRTLAIWVGVICTIFAIIPAIFIKSKSTLHENYSVLTLKNIKGSFNEIILGFKEALVIKPFRKLCIATFLIFNAFNTVATFTFFVIVYHIFNGNTRDASIWPTLFGCLGALSTTFMVIPIVAKMSKKLGKKRAFIISQAISIIGYILLWFLLIPGKPYMFIFALPFFSFGIGSLFTLMMSMTSDVIDLDELNTGKRREGIFGAIYWWMVKFGFAIAGGLSGVIISLVGFKEGIPGIEQESALTGLRIFFSGVPILGTSIAIYVMWDYDVTEEKAIEISAQLAKRKASKLTSAYQSGKLSVLLTGLDLPAYDGTDFNNKSDEELSAMFSQQLQKGVHGLCFSPYIEGQEVGDRLSESQIRQRMDIIAPHTKWIRSFSCTDGNEKIPVMAKEKGLKTMVGAWISSDRDRNEKEIKALVQLAKDGHVDIAVIGNEVLLRNELNVNEIVGYIKRVQEQIKPIPVGYVDSYYQFVENPELIAASDLILANCYPFWEGSDINNSLQDLRSMYTLAQQVSTGKRIIITETGWPNKGTDVKTAVPSDKHARQYFLQTQEWAQKESVELFYFSSFDETWKVKEEGELGARWGIWDKDEKLKY